MGQQEVHEYEALRGGSGRRLYCRLTSFSQSLQTNFRITLDGTVGSAPVKNKLRFLIAQKRLQKIKTAYFRRNKLFSGAADQI